MAAATWVFAATALLIGTPSTAVAQSAEVGRGSELFEANCAMCHGQDAGGMMGIHPSLRGAVERLTPEGVEVTIRKGRAVMPPMPPFEGRLTDEDIADVVAYLDTLPVGPRNFGGGDGGMMADTDGMMSEMGRWWPALFLIVALAVLVLVGVLLAVTRRSRRGRDQQGAIDILDKRYASGEIDHDEYQERLNALRRT